MSCFGLLFLVLFYFTRVECIPDSEMEALLDFKRNLYFPEDLRAWQEHNRSNACDFQYVECDSARQHVVAINIINQVYGGIITPLLGQLAHLERLDFSRNSLQGSIPAEMGQLTHLQRLDLSYNSLNGSIPPALANCTNLRFLALWDNNLTGPIPPGLANLTKLQWLGLANNHLTGHIPEFPFVGDRLDLSYNRLTGRIPRTFSRTLTWLNLSENGLHGPIPECLANATSLEILGLESNQLSGHIPEWLGKLTRLSSVYLSGMNALSSSIPVSIGNSTSMEYLYLDGMGLTGSIPAAVLSIGSLVQLDLSNNSLTGSIPEFECPRALESLYLSNNHLVGYTPAALTNCSGLWKFSIFNNFIQGIGSTISSDNNLTGRIPSGLCSVALDLSHNHLKSLPDFETCYSLSSFSMEHNKVEGGLMDLNLRDNNKVKMLNLRSNRLTGNISYLCGCNWNTTVVLSLAFNYFDGHIPSCIGNFTNLRSLDISNNNFSGKLPLEITRLELFKNQSANYISDYSIEFMQMTFTSMKAGTLQQYSASYDNNFMDLSNNGLEGEILPEFGQLVQMRHLNLSSNKFSGSIPRELSKLHKLELLDLSNNHLNGSIPIEVLALDIGSLDVSRNNLSGRIPSIYCTRFPNTSFQYNSGLCCENGSLPPCEEKHKNEQHKDETEESTVNKFMSMRGFYIGMVAGFYVGLSLTLYL